jgi:hypothetical protein
VIILHDESGQPLACPCGKPATIMQSVTSGGMTLGCDDHPVIAIGWPGSAHGAAAPGPDESPAIPGQAPLPVTRPVALENAVRLLFNAEFEIDLAKMERYEKLADSWISIAGMLGGQDYA